MSIGPIYGYTSNYNFTLVNYDFPRWQSYEHGNWTLLDSVIGTLLGSFGVGGVWQNGFFYNINERIIDEDTNTLYLCLVSNTSAAVGSFAQDRDANPSYWRSLSYNPANRGVWHTATEYNAQDIVSYNSQIAICLLPHLSTNNFTADVNAGYWNVLIDVTGYNIGLALTKANNLSDLMNPSSARTNLGLGSAALNQASDFLQVANNLSDGNPTLMRSSLGLRSAALAEASTFMVGSNNLTELVNKSNARSNLGLGKLATVDGVTLSQISDIGSLGIQFARTNNNNDLLPLLPVFVGDSGVGGTKGVVPAPSAGDAAAQKFLNAAGAWQVPPAPPAQPFTPVSQVRDLSVTCPSNTAITVAYSGGVLSSPTANQVFASGSSNISLSSVGPGGIQTGLTTGAGFYSVYLIGNGTTVAGMLGQNGTPTLPSGYTFYKRVGYVRLSGASNIIQTIQKGHSVYYISPVVLSSTTSGSVSNNTPVTAAVAVSSYVPPNGGGILGYINTYQSATTILDTVSSTSLGAPVSFQNNGSGTRVSLPFEFIVLDGNLYYYQTNAGSTLYLTGWRDVI